MQISGSTAKVEAKQQGQPTIARSIDQHPHDSKLGMSSTSQEPLESSGVWCAADACEVVGVRCQILEEGLRGLLVEESLQRFRRQAPVMGFLARHRNAPTALSLGRRENCRRPRRRSCAKLRSSRAPGPLQVAPHLFRARGNMSGMPLAGLEANCRFELPCKLATSIAAPGSLWEGHKTRCLCPQPADPANQTPENTLEQTHYLLYSPQYLALDTRGGSSLRPNKKCTTAHVACPGAPHQRDLDTVGQWLQ